MREVLDSPVAESLDPLLETCSELKLSCAPAGCLLRIKRLCSGPREKCRLCALGLTPGTVVQVLDSGRGLVRLMVRGCSLVLDCALACTITCEPAGQQAA